jgi:prepilin-type N-terminal cleavage/methylation domain-containing protein
VAVPSVSLTFRNGGMTLPEVLVGLVLLGILGAAGTAVLLRAARFLSVARSRVALTTAVDASLGFLDGDLARWPRGSDQRDAGRDAYRAIRLDGYLRRLAERPNRAVGVRAPRACAGGDTSSSSRPTRGRDG